MSSLSHTDPIGTSVGVLGIILAFLLYFRAKANVRLCYAIVNRQGLISPSYNLLSDEASIKYADRDIRDLSAVTILVWNRGRRTLSRSDIASSDPLILKFTNRSEKVEVLEVRPAHPTREALSAGTSIDGNLIHLDFEFLDPMDGFSFEVFYAGDPNVDIVCTGTVKGSPKPMRRYEPDPLAGGEFSSPFLLIRTCGFILFLALASSISLPFLVEHLIKLPANATGSLWSALISIPITLLWVFSMLDFRQAAVPYEIRKLVKKFK